MFRPARQRVCGKLVFFLMESRRSLHPWWSINSGCSHALRNGKDEIIGWEVFYGSRMANTKHKRETDSFHRNETSFVWLAHVTKTRTAECAPHPVSVFLDLRHFHSFYRNREKVFFFLPLKDEKKIFFKIVVLNLVPTSKWPGGTLQTQGALGPLQRLLPQWGWVGFMNQ